MNMQFSKKNSQPSNSNNSTQLCQECDIDPQAVFSSDLGLALCQECFVRFSRGICQGIGCSNFIEFYCKDHKFSKRFFCTPCCSYYHRNSKFHHHNAFKVNSSSLKNIVEQKGSVPKSENVKNSSNSKKKKMSRKKDNDPVMGEKMATNEKNEKNRVRKFYKGGVFLPKEYKHQYEGGRAPKGGVWLLVDEDSVKHKGKK